ncbi:uncharacterized protein LOC111086250 [Limulus polyphemus]|uniref:Uncharacterized protein LOC111086250 n=1 Tax=Limulus polyphemus TaxID=6850 RepID=A0ABM1SKE1_LIMPO|nr:uncharacterized protein LOC111086250 [Limulus polyphemus]
MKLMKWMELHFGRSRRKCKKGKTQDPPSDSQEYIGCLTIDDEIPSEFPGLDNIFSHTINPRGCLTPQLPNKKNKKPVNIRTSFLDLAVLPDTNSPRQRSRIKTNPWLPSRGSISSSMSSGSQSSSTSENSENCELVMKPPGPWASLSFLPSGREYSPLPAIRRIRLLEWSSADNSRLPCSPVFSNFKLNEQSSLRRMIATPISQLDSSASLENEPSIRPEINSTNIDTSADSFYKKWFLDPNLEVDEAFSEDYQLSEDGDSVPTVSPTVASSPQADSACGSCSTTPLSETAQDHLEKPDFEESLDEKMVRLQAQRQQMAEKMTAARQDDQQRQEEAVRLQQELLDYRRALLLRTLQGLRNRLEQQGERLQRAYGATVEMKMKFKDNTWAEEIN